MIPKPAPFRWTFGIRTVLGKFFILFNPMFLHPLFQDGKNEKNDCQPVAAPCRAAASVPEDTIVKVMVFVPNADYLKKKTFCLLISLVLE